MSYSMKTLAAIFMTLCSMPLFAGELVREFKGSGNTTTLDFTVESPWIIDWRLDSDYDWNISLDIVLIDAMTGQFVGGVKSGSRQNVTDRSNGVRLLRTSGRYKLRISSSLARWTIRVEQLTEEEAQLYTPKNRN
ncbi:MAG: hypothetical protein OEW64_08225 [Gammaproteobacteria bacterium]|nr:hypothetical protein [Gammaproteobacteria bacterium]MDH5304071.1 hypothetical protein [Gammaproteobacteria bacterium]MDH5323558.1 hypothetical protein [Gammaproteobacteria bacterium]